MSSRAPGSGSGDLAVVICTLGRPQGALATVRSVLRDAPAAHVVIVDQGEGDELEQLLAHEPPAPRLRVLKAPPRGLSAARNAGVRACEASVVAFTDDDCVVAPGWLAGMQAAFARDERIGLVFGNVLAEEYDRSEGFVPAYRVKAFTLVSALGSKARIEGMGACMAIRRTAWEAVRGFDEALGSGAHFRAGEDADFVVRALVRGWRVAETPDASVVHHGFRTWGQGSDLIAGYMYGLGATNVKMLRLGGLRALRPLSALAWRWAAGDPVVDLNQHPPRLPRLKAFLRGAVEGCRRPLQEGGRFA